MTVLTREQFIEYFEELQPGAGWSSPSSSLWMIEKYKVLKSKWFVCVKPIDLFYQDMGHHDYHAWCEQYCTGLVACYSCDNINQREWWGFTHYDDILLWTLKWSK